MKEKRELSPEEEMLSAYRRKAKREAVVKSVALALTCGFLLAVIVSAVSFATLYNTLYIALGILIAVSVGLSFLFYFTIFRTDLASTAERVDGIGLEERVLTMVEFSGEDSVILNRQREDTHETLKTVSVKQMKSGIPKLLMIALAVIALLSIFMMSYSTVLAVQAEETRSETSDGSDLSDEDRIIKEMIEELRRIIEESPVSPELKGYLNKLVDNLELSIKPTDSLEVKKAKVSQTAQEIHKLIEEYLSRTTIGQELQKHDTTKTLGDAIVSEQIDRVQQAFQDMYDSIDPLVKDGRYDILNQTADDIDQSIEDATVKDDKLAEALHALAEAMRKAIPPEPPEESEKEHVGQEVMDKVQDAMNQALQDIKDAFTEQDQMEDLDDKLQDAIQDALDKLDGKEQDGKLPEEEEEPEEPEDPEDPEKNKEDGENGSSPPPPAGDGEADYDTVIDGNTPYDEVYDEYEQQMKELLESGDLSEEERKLIEDYFNKLGD